MTARKSDSLKINDQSRRLRNSMMWLVRGFTLYDPRKSYPGFYLSPQQSYVLGVVHDFGPITPGDVARKLRLEKSHLTKIVNSLLEMGAVARAHDSRDRRRLMLTATAKGKRFYTELDRLSVLSYQELMEIIPEEKREPVIRAVEIMLKAMDELRKHDG